MNPILSFISGIIAAFTPCVIILIPIVLYRFSNKEKLNVKEFLTFILGFLVSYVFLGYIIDGLFTSFIQNGIKVGFGLLFVVLGLLSLGNRINPLNFPLLKSPLLFGISFSFIVSLNPCTIPYLSLIISLNQKSQVILNIASFGLGLLVPSISFAVIGKSVLKFANTNANLFHKVNQLMSVILVFSGVYLALTIKSFQRYDIYISSLFLLIVFAIILKCYFIINTKKDLFKIKNVLLLLSLLLILLGAMSHCNSYVKHESNYLEYNNIESFSHYNHEELSCSSVDLNCSVCTRCISIFTLALFFGALSILFSNKKWSFKIK